MYVIQKILLLAGYFYIYFLQARDSAVIVEKFLSQLNKTINAREKRESNDRSNVFVCLCVCEVVGVYD